MSALEICTCGSKNASSSSKEYFEVTPAGETRRAHKTMSMLKCTDCGVIRQQNSPFNGGGYNNFYAEYPPSGAEYAAKSYEHDREVARQRCDEYGVTAGTQLRVLDVGSGSGAFVDEARVRGAQAYGCELCDYAYAHDNPFVYRKAFEEILFPTDNFDLVTCHDVLEHVVDPIEFIRELKRVTKQSGTVVIDLPRFFVDAGKHHWKLAHLWYFKPEQLVKVLKEEGFVVVETRMPIPSKVVIYCYKPPEHRPSILVPPGIGDSYWSVVKLGSFLKQRGLSMPDIFIAHPRPKKYQADKRAHPFLQMFPFLHSTGESILTDGSDQAIWMEAYAKKGRTVFTDVVGCDYFISYNGWLRYGYQLEEVDPEFYSDWQTPMHESLEQLNYERMFKEKYGDYVVFYFVFQGTYTYWTKEFPLTEVMNTITTIKRQTGYTPVLVGAVWDAEEENLKQLRIMPGVVDTVGRTNLPQCFGLMKGAKAVVGYPSGLTIMSAVLGVKTLIVWNNYYDSEFAWYCAPPIVRGDTYDIAFTKGLTGEKLAYATQRLLAHDPVGPSLAPKSVRQAPIVRTAPVRKTDTDTSIAVACVLRSGGDFNSDYVNRMRNMVERNATVRFEFIALTDVDVSCNRIDITCSAPGWWAKIDLFKRGNFANFDRVVYFDLDTVIVGNIDELLLSTGPFMALRPWNSANRKAGMCASGLMSWKPKDYEFVYDEFDPRFIDRFPRGDQQYISECLKLHKQEYSPIQKAIEGIYSYKRNCRRGLPENARVVMFHGNPRPSQAPAYWVKRYWK